MTAVLTDKLPYLDTLELGVGSHPAPNNGLVAACVMEAVAYVTGEPWSDHPACVSPVIASFLRSWNDRLPDADRQMLKPYIVKVVGTNTGKKDDETRAWMLIDWLARECAPAFMRLAGLTAQAELVEQLAPLTSTATARKAQPTLDTARRAAAPAAAEARAVAGDAAWAAAGAAARAAAWAVAGDAAWAAAWAAAGDAAWAVAGAAARAAAWAVLAPTVAELQASALLLLDRMIAVGA